MQNEHKNRRLLHLFLILLSAFGIISSVILLGVSYIQSSRQEKPPVYKNAISNKRVLFISSYSNTHDTVNAQLTGMQKVFSKSNVYLDVEYMDMKNYNSAENTRLFYETMKYKLSHHEKYGAIILGDDAALDFALEYQTELFYKTPLIFLGINNLDKARHAVENPFVTGSTEDFEFEKILDIAIMQNPVGKYILGIYDTSISGLGDEKQFFALQQRYPQYTFVGMKTSDYSRTGLGEAIAKLAKDNIVLCMSAFEDKDGNSYTISEIAQLFYAYASIPVYTKLYGTVGKGFLGGYLYDYEESGVYSALTAVQVLNGKDISAIPLNEDIPSHFYFDYSLMNHYRLDTSILPADTIFVNRQPSYWTRYATVLIPFIIIVLSLFLLLTFVIFYAHQLKITLNTDFLTGLPNRDAAQTEVSRLIKEKKDFSVIMLDVEDLKSINDFYSYACGDCILMELSQRLSSLADSGDYTVARYGGDEFVIIWKGGQLHKNSTILFMLKQMIASPFEYKDNQIFVRISIGIANCSEKDECSMETYFSNADTAMVEAKRTGKNKTVFFTNEMRESIQTKQEITRILENACNSEDGFYVLYQPQIDITSGEIHGYEALCRLKTVKIFPGQFIPVAEESGLITKIGRIMTEQVIKQLVEWRAKGFPLRKVSINYSAAQMADKEYVSFLKTLLEKNALSPSLIEIEITESLFMGNKKLASELAAEFKEIGIKLALDDFGTGYSSLSYLTYIPVETIKLDKTMVDANLQEGKEGLIGNIINLVHSLNMKLIIEGVEQKWQYDMLKKINGDIIQGYYFSKPIPAKEVENFSPAAEL